MIIAEIRGLCLRIVKSEPRAEVIISRSFEEACD